MLEESIGVLKETVSIEQSNKFSSGILSKENQNQRPVKKPL